MQGGSDMKNAIGVILPGNDEKVILFFFFHEVWVICPVNSAYSLFGQRSQRKALGKL